MYTIGELPSNLTCTLKGTKLQLAMRSLLSNCITGVVTNTLTKHIPGIAGVLVAGVLSVLQLVALLILGNCCVRSTGTEAKSGTEVKRSIAGFGCVVESWTRADTFRLSAIKLLSTGLCAL